MQLSLEMQVHFSVLAVFLEISPACLLVWNPIYISQCVFRKWELKGDLWIWNSLSQPARRVCKAWGHSEIKALIRDSTIFICTSRQAQLAWAFIDRKSQFWRMAAVSTCLKKTFIVVNVITGVSNCFSQFNIVISTKQWCQKIVMSTSMPVSFTIWFMWLVFQLLGTIWLVLTLFMHGHYHGVYQVQEGWRVFIFSILIVKDSNSKNTLRFLRGKNSKIQTGKKLPSLINV